MGSGGALIRLLTKDERVFRPSCNIRPEKIASYVCTETCPRDGSHVDTGSWPPHCTNDCFPCSVFSHVGDECVKSPVDCGNTLMLKMADMNYFV